jgi:ketosteroid isomerase-like protein
MKAETFYATLVNATLLTFALACDRSNPPSAPAVASRTAASRIQASSPRSTTFGNAEREEPEEDGPGSAQVGKIYKLQAAFHRAKTTQDLDLMMSLWDPDGTLTVQGNSHSPFVGAEQIKAFWQTSGSFTHRRFSLVPSFKTQIVVRGDEAWLYFECHDVGDYDLSTRAIVGDTYLAGTLRNVDGKWVFSNMTAGTAFPLSVDHYFFP